MGLACIFLCETVSMNPMPQPVSRMSDIELPRPVQVATTEAAVPRSPRPDVYHHVYRNLRLEILDLKIVNTRLMIDLMVEQCRFSLAQKSRKFSTLQLAVLSFALGALTMKARLLWF